MPQKSLIGSEGICLENKPGLQEALKIYNTVNECTTEPELGQSVGEKPYKNPNFNGYSFPMESFKNGCEARCDIDLNRKTASIGWMCTD